MQVAEGGKYRNRMFPSELAEMQHILCIHVPEEIEHDATRRRSKEKSKAVPWVVYSLSV
jgi:hypothetical protein